MKIQSLPAQPLPFHAPRSFRPDPVKLLHSLVDVVCVIDSKGIFQYVSPSSRHLFGYSAKEMIGASFLSFIHPDDVHKTVAKAKGKGMGCKTSHFENRYIRKDGTLVWVHWSGRWREEDDLLYCVARDGSAKREAEQRLFKAQQLASVAHFEYDVLKNVYTYTSPNFFALLGLCKKKHKAFTAENLLSLIHPDDLQKVKENILQPESTYNPRLEYRIIRPDGKLIYIDRIREVIRDKEGRAVKTVGTIQDITNRKIGELALQRSEERFRSLVQNSNDLIGVIDTEGNYSFIAANVRLHLGYTAEALQGRNAFDFIHPFDADWLKRILTGIDAAEILNLPPFRFRNSQGVWRWVEGTLSNQLDNPAIRGLVINSRDVTSRIEQEAELRRLSLVAKETENAVVITSADRKTLWANAAFTHMTGYLLEEVMGKSPASLLEGPETDKDTVQFILRAYKEGKPFRVEILNYKKDGEPFWSDLQVQPILNKEGKVEQYFSIRKDITKQKRLEKELAEERHKRTSAVIAAQEKERAIVSQELHDNVNQVLTTVKLYTEMCRDGIGDTREIMTKSIELLQASINEIRSLSKRLSAPSLGQIKLAESVAELIAAVDATKKLSISLDTAAVQGLEVEQATHLAVYRILQEHLTNILKHACARHVHIVFARSQDLLGLFIKDDGIGFDQNKKSSGIGLANMRTRAENLKGSLDLRTAPGKGCELHLWVPCK